MTIKLQKKWIILVALLVAVAAAFVLVKPSDGHHYPSAVSIIQKVGATDTHSDALKGEDPNHQAYGTFNRYYSIGVVVEPSQDQFEADVAVWKDNIKSGQKLIIFPNDHMLVTLITAPGYEDVPGIETFQYPADQIAQMIGGHYTIVTGT